MRAVAVFCALLAVAVLSAADPIDRHALVTRHNPRLRRVDPDAPVTVGNGGFAFTADITGLQTLAAEYHREGVPTETQCRWAWVTDSNPQAFKLVDANRDYVLPDGRTMGFPTRAETPAGEWLRRNPRSHPLGQLLLVWDRPGADGITSADVQAPEQVLDLWSGVITSRFRLGGELVEVTTACDPQTDTVAVRVSSPLVGAGRLRVRLAFARGHDPAVKNTPALDWTGEDAHQSQLLDPVTVERVVGELTYFVRCSRPLRREGPHRFAIETDVGRDLLELAVRFSPRREEVPDAPKVFAASTRHWDQFWRRTAAVDFTGSTNPLAAKLEKRIILSRYLAAVQMAGDVPPQESGLTCNTWYGKHHTEMIWWHAAHFALWGQPEALERNLAWYVAQLPAARALATERGLRGARWAKMTGPQMRESPGGNPLIAWNQPHPIYLAELLYRRAPTPATLARWKDLVLETAEGAAGMLNEEGQGGRFSLGPPVWIVQEIHDPAASRNPTFELDYWRWALGVAQKWRERLGMERDADWDRRIARLAPLPVKDGRYVALESHPDTWDNRESRHDHPSMLMPLGVLPGGPEVDRATMGRTLDAVLAHWDWETKIWGWDYPMIAMTATRLGRPQDAVEILLRDGPNNRYLPTGHCPQRSDNRLDPHAPPGARRREIATYLPANGALLSAVALMVAGWDGCSVDQPGIPKDGSWHVRSEGLARLP